MNLAEQIESAEKKYRQILEEYFIRTWGETRLFSHDIDHHRRVWHYAKELLAETVAHEPYRITFRPEELLVACYLHDLGMSIDPGERHGIHSSIICREFLAVNSLNEAEFIETLKAIEYHDRKAPFCKVDTSEILTFLTIADDLDAFGYIGISRYLEIYLIRGIKREEIGHKIMANAFKRFLNFRSVFGHNKELFDKHSSRFNQLNDFFLAYNCQFEDTRTATRDPLGYALIINLISEAIKKSNKSINYLTGLSTLSFDPIVNNFLLQLNSELLTFRSILEY